MRRGPSPARIKKQIGFLELAHGGTLFLDEIGEMPLDLQKALLRALESRAIWRVGGTRAVEIDVRIIAATNQDLKAKVKDKTFREDLFYRICDIPVRLPPLRQRGIDALLIARAYMEELTEKGYPKKRFNTEAERFIREYPWPGNIRELKTALRTQYVHSLCYQQKNLTDGMHPQLSVHAFQVPSNHVR
jgi:transcriptional regulator with GAF, ATPase, and Fis domain